MLIDTDVLVGFLRGNKAANAALLSVRNGAISTVTYLELLQGIRSKVEVRSLRVDLQTLELPVLPLDPQIGQRAILLMEAYRPAHGLDMEDALIAATALETGRTLMSGNAKHFRFIAGLELAQVKM